MKKLCGCEASCGCGDDIRSAELACGQGVPECVNCEECSEAFKANCVFYKDDTINNIGLLKGSNLRDDIQKLILLTVNPNCVYPNSSCNSVVGVHSKKIQQTTIELGWTALTGNVSYQIEYRLPSSLNWTLNAAVATNYDTIGGLVPNTTYYVRVRTLCSSNSCTSLTFEIKTKSN
jgi:hypothetical protein